MRSRLLCKPRLAPAARVNFARRPTILAASTFFLCVFQERPAAWAFPASSGSCSSRSTTSNNHLDTAISMAKSTQELQSQWAGGIDVWSAVPLANGETLAIQNRVKRTSDGNDASEQDAWPDIVCDSILYGFGAYNPRGQVISDEMNEQQRALLRADVQRGLLTDAGATFWEAASLWEDGSYEKGFIVAIPSASSNSTLHQAQSWVVDLATKYNQGAIYKFHFEEGRLMRETVPVLDPGTDAMVQVVRDDIPIPDSLFRK